MNGTSNATSLAHQSVDTPKRLPANPPKGGSGYDDRGHVFGPEVILPIQFSPPHNDEGRCSGERRLMLAVLEDAVVTLKFHLRGPSVHSRRIVAEIENWLASGSRAHTFAFGTICDVLGFDVAAVRQAIKTWTRPERGEPKYRRMHSGPGRHQIGLAQRRER